MSNDFKRKEPNKTEKVLYELFMQQQGMERNLMTNSALLISIAMQMKIEPEKLGEMLTTDNQQIKDYSDRINKTIDKLQAEKKPTEESTDPSPADNTQKD